MNDRPLFDYSTYVKIPTFSPKHVSIHFNNDDSFIISFYSDTNKKSTWRQIYYPQIIYHIIDDAFVFGICSFRSFLEENISLRISDGHIYIDFPKIYWSDLSFPNGVSYSLPKKLNFVVLYRHAECDKQIMKWEETKGMILYGDKNTFFNLSDILLYVSDLIGTEKLYVYAQRNKDKQTSLYICAKCGGEYMAEEDTQIDDWSRISFKLFGIPISTEIPIEHRFARNIGDIWMRDVIRIDIENEDTIPQLSFHTRTIYETGKTNTNREY